MAFTAPASAQSLFPLQPHPTETAWPTERWAVGPMPAETAARVQPLIDDAMARDVSDVMGQTRGLVIVWQGKLVAEAYADGFGPETKQISWSMAKSITQALVGRAVQLDLIESIDDPMPSPFETSDPRAAITWRQWLQMTDGLDYSELGDATVNNDVVQMMYGRGKYDVAQYAVDELPPLHPPGEVWNYSSAGFHLLGRGLQQTLKASDGDRIADMRDHFSSQEKTNALRRRIGKTYDHSLKKMEADGRSMPMSREAYVSGILKGMREMAETPDDISSQLVSSLMTTSTFFYPLGMDAQPEFDPSGTFLGGSLVWASARDFAKFGYLYLRGGMWEGERLLPEGWVDFARTRGPAENVNVYGAGWWTTAYGEPLSHNQSATTPPWDAFHAGGFEGQRIWIVPSRDLVIVRLGLMKDTDANKSALYEWLQEVSRAFPEVEPVAN